MMRVVRFLMMLFCEVGLKRSNQPSHLSSRHTDKTSRDQRQSIQHIPVLSCVWLPSEERSVPALDTLERFK